MLQEAEAKRLKDDYAKARKIAEQKAADFDKVREAARGLNKELEDKANMLKIQEAQVAKLAVCLIGLVLSRLLHMPQLNLLSCSNHTS